jgi:hypothetical protein
MASGTVSRYNIHGICTFDILDHSGAGVQKLLDVQGRYRCFRTACDPAVPPDLRVTIGRFTPQLAGCLSLDDACWVKEDYLYHRRETYKLGAGWSFDVRGLNSATLEVRIQANLAGRPFIAGRIIDFFLFYLLLQRGYSLLHASAVALGGDVFAFAARGGGGKTTLALAAALDDGLRFLGDNFVILKDGEIFSYLSDLNLFKYNLHPHIWDSLTRLEKWRFYVWLLVYRLSFGYIKVFSAVSPLRFLPLPVEASGRLRQLTLLQTFAQSSCAVLECESLVSHLTSNMKLEFFSFVRHAALVGCVFPDSDFARVWETYPAVLRANLPKDAVYQQMALPSQITDAVKTQALAAGAGGQPDAHR